MSPTCGVVINTYWYILGFPVESYSHTLHQTVYYLNGVSLPRSFLRVAKVHFKAKHVSDAWILQFSWAIYYSHGIFTVMAGKGQWNTLYCIYLVVVVVVGYPYKQQEHLRVLIECRIFFHRINACSHKTEYIGENCHKQIQKIFTIDI